MRRAAIALIAALAALTPVAAPAFTGATTAAAAAPDEPPFHKIVFPVQEKVSYSDDWGAARAGGRSHQGNDLMGQKLFHEVAAADGVISWVKVDDGSAGSSGNMLSLKGDDGWSYWYIHVNNDTPGTDDHANPPEYRFAPGIQAGSRVKARDFIAYMGDSGDAESTGPHLHFEMHQPDGTAIDPWTSLRLAQGLAAGNRCSFPSNPDPRPAPASGAGYWVLGQDGGVFTFGSAGFFGSTGGMKLNQPIVTMAATATSRGYWLAATDGGIFAFGAAYQGSLPGNGLCQNPAARRIVATATGQGYWITADDGSTSAFGDARWLGAPNTLGLARIAPIVGMAVAR